MIILVDIDGVIFNTQETLLNFLNNRYDKSYTINDIISYDWFDKTFKNPWGFMEKPEFWYAVKTNPDAIKYITKWIQKGHIVKIITASYFHRGIFSKMSKLKRDFGGVIRDEDIIVCHDKHWVLGDILIDDCFDNAEQYSMFPGQYSILYAQPWNINQYLHENVIEKMVCYDSWSEIDAYIKFWESRC